MSLPESGFEWVVVIAFSAISFVLVYAGFRQRNLSWLLWGTAFGVPTLSVSSVVMWVLAGLIAGLGWWFGRWGR